MECTKYFLASLAFFLFVQFTGAQPFASLKDGKLILDNGVVKRIVELDQRDGVLTKNLILLKSNTEFLNAWQESEFSFLLNDQPVSSTGNWNFLSFNAIDTEYHGSGAEIILERKNVPMKLLET